MNKPVLVLAVALLLTLGASVFATGVQEKAPASPAVGKSPSRAPWGRRCATRRS
jgi:hypothetical protein